MNKAGFEVYHDGNLCKCEDGKKEDVFEEVDKLWNVVKTYTIEKILGDDNKNTCGA